ncbi:unnamed protein product [Orchesella dallaii]|uniref:SIAH-type domain-containing protein n=1 Tax=Orchesella dallaii TaxID=48710 RepID=A0ABP1RLG0_9HEXA
MFRSSRERNIPVLGICNVCISNLLECPQCRTKYGAKQIRSRVLEALLDSLMFECKFCDKGCKYLCHRNGISNHAYTCQFNPDLIPLCELLGWGDCNFPIDGAGGSSSEFRRSEIINHFTEVHKKLYNLGKRLVVAGRSIKTWMLGSFSEQEKCGAVLWGLNEDEHSPLFLFTLKINSVTQFLSFSCIQIWGADPMKKYRVDFSFVRSIPAPTPDSRDVLQSGIYKLNPLLIGWTLNAYSPREALYMLKSCPIGVYKPMLIDTKFGNSSQDSLCVDISLIA